MYASGLLHYFITFVLSIKFHRFYIYIVSYIWSCYNFSKLNAILVHDLPWIAFIFYFQNVQAAKNVSLLLFTFNILSLKIVFWKVSKLNNKFGFLWLFYKMQVLQICKHSLHVNICLSWWAVVSCMCFVSDLQENEEKFTLFGLIFPQRKNDIYSINCIKPCICVINGSIYVKL